MRARVEHVKRLLRGSNAARARNPKVLLCLIASVLAHNSIWLSLRTTPATYFVDGGRILEWLEPLLLLDELLSLLESPFWDKF